MKLFFAFLLFLAPAAQAAPPRTILLFGDSIVAGYGLGAADSVPARLQTMLAHKGYQVSIINGGVSGDTTAAGRARLDFALKRHQPGLVILELGANDMLRGLPPKLARENLAAMIETLQIAKVPVILSAVESNPGLGPEYVKEFNAIYPDLAKQYNVPLYPFLLASVFNKPAVMQADGVHPNAKGAEIIAAELAAYLERNVLKP